MNKVYTTPAGIAKYCHLSKPSTKFRPEGVYDVTLLLDGQEAADMMAQIDEAVQANLAEIAKTKKGGRIKEADLPYSPELDKDGNETGKTQFKFHQVASATAKDGTKYEFAVVMFDSKKKVIHPNNVGFGTRLKVAYELYPYFVASTGAGVSLRLKAVQILDLVVGGEDASRYGFGEEEGYADETDSDVTEDDLAKAEGNPAGDF